ncbi:MAG: choice-of-anchor Q domain-containing protein [Bacteroidales bacterium]
MWVYKGGSIHVNGDKDSLVTFQGDRLEYDYRDLPGQWDRIWINEGSVNNEFNYAVIQNGFIGIQLELMSQDMGNTLVLNNTVIQNMSRWGLFTIASRVRAANSVFANCAENTLFLSVGGEYDFRHCTFADYWNHTIRQDPSFIVSNHLVVQSPEGGLQILQGDLIKAYFGNCIVYGNVEEEIILANEEGTLFNYEFENCILKTLLDISNDPFFIKCRKNADPLFVDYTENNYRIDTLSPAIDSGNPEIVNASLIDISLDPDGNSRVSDEAPDIGTYEFIPE